jgi:REP element-mobilizing transposase RayT
VPRQPRLRSSDHLYHVTARGVARRKIFRSDADGRVFLSALGEVIVERGWRCHCYCLMPNHFHLLVATPRADLPEGMRDLNSSYATRFNTAHELSGHVFQGRYGSRLVATDPHAREVSRYIPLNPVRAGLCSDPADWPWSSYRAAAGITRPPAWLTIADILHWFGEGDEAKKAYREFVACGHRVLDPEAAALRELLGGGDAEAIRRVQREHGYSLRAIARALGLHHSTLAQRLSADPPKGV